MSKTHKFIPDLRIRKPYRREPKIKQVPPYVPFDTFDEDEDSDGDEYPYETAEDEWDRIASGRGIHRR